MQKLVLKAIAFCFFFIACQASIKLNAQTQIEIVVGCPDFSEKDIDQIKTDINAMAGINFLGYTYTDNLILLKYDRSVYGDGNSLATAIQSAVQYKFYYKPYQTRKDVIGDHITAQENSPTH